MRKGSSCVTVPAQALDEAKPSGNALNNGSHTVCISVAKFWFCEDFKEGKNITIQKNELFTPFSHTGQLPISMSITLTHGFTVTPSYAGTICSSALVADEPGCTQGDYREDMFS